MPIYMDRHDVTDEVTAEHVAQLHQADLKIQHKFACKGITYWFDGERNTAFCLIQAPNKQALKNMHDHAHGAVPHSIIEVDDKIVESFLGRIEDPEMGQTSSLNIIDDSAFRVIMVTSFGRTTFENNNATQLKDVLHRHTKSVKHILNRFDGRMVKQESECLLVSFKNVSNSIKCALDIQDDFKEIIKSVENFQLDLNIGISAGPPVTDKDELFQDAISVAKRMCHVVKGNIVVSSEVQNLYKSENLNDSIDKNLVHSLSPSDDRFLQQLMEYTEKNWQQNELKVEDFSKNLGFSKAQLYRKMILLTGSSPNSFIKDYRLRKALTMLNKQIGNISEIAFETGFNSPAYFSKCFNETYGILPSNYIRQQISLS